MDSIYVEDGIADSVNTVGCLRWALAAAALAPGPTVSIEIKPKLEITVNSQLYISSTAVPLSIYGNGATITCSKPDAVSIFKFDACNVEIHELCLDGEYQDMHGIIANTATLRLYGMTLHDFSSTSTVVYGGAIHTVNTKLLLEKAKITDCKGFTGGGFCSAGGTFTMNRSVVSNCKAAAGGGGLLASCSFSIASSEIGNNSASQRGGGLEIESSATGSIISSLIRHNTVTGVVCGPPLMGGGGICSFDSNTKIINSTIANNTCQTIGAGVHALCFKAPSSLTILNTTIASNTNTSMEHGGGGVYADGLVPVVANTLISSNYSKFIGERSPDFVCVINGVLTPVKSGGGNIVSTGTFGFYQPKDRIGTRANPLMTGVLPLANNGGSMLSMAIVPNSIAINNGLNSAVPIDIAYDQRGPPFPRTNGTVDTGSFEYKTA